jgi:hypothetical protein
LAGVNKTRLPNHPLGHQGNEVDEDGKPKGRDVEINMFEEHIFIEERTNVTSYYLKNIMTWDIKDCDKFLIKSSYEVWELDQRDVCYGSVQTNYSR